MTGSGRVSLVGAGPGDPDLITVAGLDRLRTADVVVFDRLVDRRLLEEARPDAELIDAGKSRGDQRMGQEQINALLLERAQAGKSVCRLKGGDPFVFGRGGEEALALAQSGVSWEVVPGVTSAVAAPAYAGIPVTHRGLATSFTVITGSEDPDKPDSQVDWEAVAATRGTLVFLMAWETLESITGALVARGMSAARPVALVRWGATKRQQVVAGTLDDIARKAEAAGMGSPAVLVVGEVAGLRRKLGWFDTGPLFGKRVLVTRTRTQASRLSRLLEAQGADPVEVPVISVLPIEDPAGIDRALVELDRYDWVTFSSVNGVNSVAARLAALGRDARIFHGVRVAAIGPATGGAVLSMGIRADLVPEEYLAESVVEEMGRHGIDGRRVLVFRSDIGRDALARGLKEKGASVDEVVAYRTQMEDGSKDRARQAFSTAGGLDIVTFTSSSGVDSLLDLLSGEVETINKTLVASIGPITAGRARERGIDVDIVASEQTVPGLVAAIVDHFAGAEH